MAPKPLEKLGNKFVVEFDGFRKLTLKERLLILIGYNLQTLSKVCVDKRNTSVKARTFVVLTKQVTPEGQAQQETA